ncbi:MAG: DUF1674 domain-containing protein [Pseudomonadota bacterium]
MPDLPQAAYSFRDDANVPAFDDAKALFVFDGICVLCSTGVRWLMRYDDDKQVMFTTMQEGVGRALGEHYGIDLDGTYLVIIDGKAATKSTGYLRLCALLGGPWHVLRLFWLVPRFIRDWAYDLVARNRYSWFGTADYCGLLTPDQRARLILPALKKETHMSKSRKETTEEKQKRKDKAGADLPKEVGGQAGPEPTRYGDWEKNGITSDF